MDNDIIERILSVWEKDGKIDSQRITDETIATPILHAKYLRIYASWKRKQSSAKLELNRLKQKKIRYYRGEMSKDELDELGWKQWQYNRPMKNELEQLISSDADVFNKVLELEELDTIVYVLDSIMTQIKSRDFEISNHIKHKLYEKGEG